MNLKNLLSGILFLCSFALVYYLYADIQKVIETRSLIESSEGRVIERLKLIREAESLYQEQFGKYTSSWDTLVNFISNAKVPIIQRREIIKQKSYGGEEVTVVTDTLGFDTAFDRIFKKHYSMSASESGTFEGFKVKVGDRVIKNQKPYVINIDGKKTLPPLLEKGTVDSLADVKIGQTVTKGQLMISYSDYIFDPKLDLSKLGEIPDSGGAKFDIFVGKIDKNGVMIDVIEVVDSHPINPQRNENNELKTRKPLRFGSRLDVSTTGNWE